MSRNKTILLLLKASIASTLIGLSCKEHLPAYIDPVNIVDLKLEAKYIYTHSENSLHFDFILTNKFDETLQGDARAINARGAIVLRRDTSYHRTITLTAADVVNGYNPTTGMLTIDPKSSVRIRFVWNFIDDNGRDLRQTAFVYYPDESCIAWGCRIAYNETFQLAGEVKLFERIPTMEGAPFEFSMCHVNIHVLQNYCPIITPDEACRP